MLTSDDRPIALVYAPHGRDADVAGALLQEAGVEALAVETVEAFLASLSDDVCFVVLTIEAVRGANLRALTERLASQPPWSDLPFILLTQRGGGLERNPEAARLSETLGNVSFLERPFHPTTFISMAHAALKSRQRQLEARVRMDDIREGEASLETALVAGRLGSWQLDLATRALTTSDACKALFGRAPDDTLTYEDLIATIHPDDRAAVVAKVERTIATGEDYEVEYRVTPAGSAMRWAEVRARMVKDRLGAPLKLVGVSSDVTQRKLAEMALRSTNDMLEHRVVERTAELERAHRDRERAEAQLHQSQKLEMIGQLTGGVAHDFNNLLMAVMGNLELLRKQLPDNPRALRLLEGASQGARRGATLTQRLLAFSRQQELEVKPCHIGALVRGMGDLLERSAGHLVQLEYDLDDAAPAAAVDASQVELALMNLVINAKDAMPDGGVVRVLVDAVDEAGTSELAQGGYVRIRVIDTGAGMDAATLAKATEPFFSTKPVGKGTGLGLSMIHGLAVQLKGGLRLQSVVGAGTTAELLLPTTNQAPQSPDVRAAAASASGAPLRILVVDDDPLIAMSTVDMLEDLGHDVVEKNSAADALSYLETAAPVDLVITDYAMPVMTGMELARHIKGTRPELRVILATGFAEFSDPAEDGLPRLAKPYTQAQLQDTIRAVS